LELRKKGEDTLAEIRRRFIWPNHKRKAWKIAKLRERRGSVYPKIVLLSLVPAVSRSHLALPPTRPISWSIVWRRG